MRKKLDTRFPAARIKKIMQVDEEVGKIALSTPLLVSKALELFLQDLLDRTYAVMRERGGKTLNSGHLKQCLEQFKEYDFLKELASTISDTAPETPRASGAGLDGPAGSNSMGRGRRRRIDGEDAETEDSSDSARRHFKVGRPQHGTDSGAYDATAPSSRGMKRELCPNTAQLRDEHEPSMSSGEMKKMKVERPNEAIPVESRTGIMQENGRRGFDLNFDLNASPEFEEPAGQLKPDLAPELPKAETFSKPSGDSDEDYDAE